MKVYHKLFFLSVGFVVPLLGTINQEYRYSDLFCPVMMNDIGIESFLSHTYNHPEYRNVLAHNFSHILQFLRHAKDSQQGRAYVQSVFRLFSNKLKSVQYINPMALIDFLDQLSEILKDQFTPATSYLHMVQAQINDILYGSFLSKFDKFKREPNLFFNDVSLEIIRTLRTSRLSPDDVSEQELRKTMLVFLETAVNKLVWSPADGVKTWQTTKKVADKLADLHDNSLLDDPDDLNDLFVSLIERYCFFLDIMSPSLDVAFYQQVKKDLEEKSSILIDLEEQEDLIETKGERLRYVIMEGEARARAREHGIVV